MFRSVSFQTEISITQALAVKILLALYGKPGDLRIGVARSETGKLEAMRGFLISFGQVSLVFQTYTGDITFVFASAL